VRTCNAGRNGQKSPRRSGGSLGGSGPWNPRSFPPGHVTLAQLVAADPERREARPPTSCKAKYPAKRPPPDNRCGEAQGKRLSRPAKHLTVARRSRPMSPSSQLIDSAMSKNSSWSHTSHCAAIHQSLFSVDLSREDNWKVEPPDRGTWPGRACPCSGSQLDVSFMVESWAMRLQCVRLPLVLLACALSGGRLSRRRYDSACARRRS
jgi:hypothetical protein